MTTRDGDLNLVSRTCATSCESRSFDDLIVQCCDTDLCNGKQLDNETFEKFKTTTKATKATINKVEPDLSNSFKNDDENNLSLDTDEDDDTEDDGQFITDKEPNLSIVRKVSITNKNNFNLIKPQKLFYLLSLLILLIN
jgi:hypothetical protein